MAMPGTHSSSISATSSCGRTSGSGTSSVSRRKLVTFENPPKVAVYGSLMNFYSEKNQKSGQVNWGVTGIYWKQALKCVESILSHLRLTNEHVQSII